MLHLVIVSLLICFCKCSDQSIVIFAIGAHEPWRYYNDDEGKGEPGFAVGMPKSIFPKTNSLPLKIQFPKRKLYRIPTIRFEYGANLLLVSGRVRVGIFHEIFRFQMRFQILLGAGSEEIGSTLFEARGPFWKNGLSGKWPLRFSDILAFFWQVNCVHQNLGDLYVRDEILHMLYRNYNIGICMP